MSISIGGIADYYNRYYGSGINTNNNLRTQEGEVSDATEKAMKRAGLEKCETCESRKYQDGSNENDVSFKAPGHISPQASAATVMAHEQQHVSNAFQKAGESNGKVVNASVSLQTSVCPECGRSYVSGGVTNTTIKYNTGTPYGNSMKNFDAANGAIGSNIDVAC